jgi:hypothetical protein
MVEDSTDLVENKFVESTESFIFVCICQSQKHTVILVFISSTLEEAGNALLTSK